MKQSKRQSRLWRALSNPSRRRILDRLRDGPKTTGELAAAFPKLSRFAVMQHLGVLTDARLVLVRREGRCRFNYLNAVPLAELYERWISAYAQPIAHAAIAFRRSIEIGSHPQKGQVMPKSPTDFRVAKVELEIPIDAPPSRVWDALVNETTTWWRKDFYTSAKTRAFKIEAFPGGRMYEDWGGNDGAVWANVMSVEAGKFIHFVGYLTPDYGGPAQTMFRFAIEASGEGTILKVSDTIFGNLSDSTQEQISSGWKLLFEEGLKPYIEDLACSPVR